MSELMCEVCGHPIADHHKRHGCNRIVETRKGGPSGLMARACDCKEYPKKPDAESVIKAIEASGRVTVDRARFERIWNVAVAAHEELSEEAGYGGSGTTGTCAAVEWLQPGDLEPLA